MMLSKSPLRQSGSALLSILLIVGLTAMFLMLLRMSTSGWGYTGYAGYHRGPSFWYWGGPSVYTGPSVRSGSVSGPGNTGGGYSGGK
jgi:hypothetical protein